MLLYRKVHDAEWNRIPQEVRDDMLRRENCQYHVPDPQATADAELGRAVQAAVRSGHVDSQYLDEWAGAIEAESGHSCANDPALNILRAVAAVLKPRERQNATHD